MINMKNLQQFSLFVKYLYIVQLVKMIILKNYRKLKVKIVEDLIL